MSVVQLKKEKSLDELVTEIRGLMYDITSIESRLTKKRVIAGQRLLELRTRIEAGEAGDVTWWDYYDKHLSSFRYRKDAEKLLKIAAAENPEEASEAQRNHEHQAKHRAKHDSAYVSGKAKPKPTSPGNSSPCGTRFRCPSCVGSVPSQLIQVLYA